MIKVGIIDDEELARKVLEEYCGKIDNFTLVLSTGNPFEFINYIQQNEVDLIFLDIEMPEINGLEVLGSLVRPPKVILTTAYSEYALESYEHGVLDYLLKPIKLERFLKAVNRVSASNVATAELTNERQALQIKHDGLLVSIPFTSIQYIQSFGNYLKIFTDARMYLITETLVNMTDMLSDNFQRTHKSYIANLDRVTKATRTTLLIKNTKVPVSTTYKVLVSEKLEALVRSSKES